MRLVDHILDHMLNHLLNYMSDHVLDHIIIDLMTMALHSLPEQIGAKKHTMKLEYGKQSPYWPIYSLRLIELETLKTCFETNLANAFIRIFNLLISASIFFV